MESELSRLDRLSEALTQDGQAMVLALVILIIGLFVARWADKGLRAALRRLLPTSPYVTTFCNIVYVSMVAIIVVAAALEFGAKPVNMIRLLTIITLVAAGLMIFLRPFIPSLPFKVGQTIKAGDLLGKVEAISLINTRLRTFDGTTFFVQRHRHQLSLYSDPPLENRRQDPLRSGSDQGQTDVGSGDDRRPSRKNKARTHGLCAQSGQKFRGPGRTLLGKQQGLLGGTLRLVGKSQTAFR